MPFLLTRLRLVIGVVVATALVVVLFVGATVRLFIDPHTNQPRHVDAILVLGGDGPRLQKGLALARQGYAPLLVVSMGDPPPPAACQQWLSPSPAVRVVCFRPTPFTTQGEARFIGQLAKQDALHSIIVVSGTAQTTRARVRVSRCYSGTILIDPVEPGGWHAKIYSWAYEWGTLIKAETWQRGC